MRIGITCYPTYGGSGVVATELGKHLARVGEEVHFISYALPYRLSGVTPNIYFHEVEVLQYPLFQYPPYSLSLAAKMVEVVERHHLDLLHVHYAIPHASSAYLARQILGDRNLKYITTLHGTDITLIGSDPSYYTITRFSIENSSGVTAVSNYLKKETESVFKVNKKIEVIPNFIPIEITIPINRKDLRKNFADKDEYILTHISNFRPLKRVTDLVPILKNVSQRLKVKLLMVGDGPDRYITEEQCRRENICRQVIFLGKQENIQDILAISDVVVIPSASESFGLVALEALAYGVPCVSTNVGGLPEVNRHGETGFLVNVGDLQAFSEAIVTILSDRALAQKMSDRGREIAQSEFSATKIIPQYINYYNKILGA
jgi:N-acetyl-alpha-D-glucosaminyl L-malate synthase BshA